MHARALFVAAMLISGALGCSSSDSVPEATPVSTGGASGSGGVAGAQLGGSGGATVAGSGGSSASGGSAAAGAGGLATGGSSATGGDTAAGGNAAASGGGGSAGAAQDAGTGGAPPDGSSVTDADASPTLPPNADVLAVMKKVADWQLVKLGTSTAKSWVEGAMWTGMLALYDVSQDAKYLDATEAWATANSYQLLNAPTTNADNQCAAQAYYELYLLDPTPQNLTLMVDPAKASFDQMVAAGNNTWTWVDALFMSPPGVARLYAITQDTKYLTFLDTNWQKTKNTLFSAQDGLWWRDPPPSVASGNPRDIFWSRGNGWVLAASARVIEYLPADWTQRDMYVQNIQTMAAALLPIQQSDGLWRSDLLHPDVYPNPESSGSAFFAYGLAWGINHGILDRATYQEPAVKAWNGLVATCVGADGLFGYVQPPGWQPGPATATQSSPYGVGAFLLAGSEIARL
jgi:unsaturated rhamnogalacturonyl hydrolase